MNMDDEILALKGVSAILSDMSEVKESMHINSNLSLLLLSNVIDGIINDIEFKTKGGQ